MSYYLGKVGRAGARLYSSCKDLYNDVNAAYLTGAVDIIAIRQKDGSLKSTPFHVRFGKLGVLRTGDIKEVSWKLSLDLLKSKIHLEGFEGLSMNYFQLCLLNHNNSSNNV